jgi:hypothetical protein
MLTAHPLQGPPHLHSLARCFYCLSCPQGFRPPFDPPLCGPCDEALILRFSSRTLSRCAAFCRTTAPTFAGLPVKTHPTKQREMLLAKAGVTLAYCIVPLPRDKTEKITLLIREGFQLFLVPSFADRTSLFEQLALNWKRCAPCQPTSHCLSGAAIVWLAPVAIPKRGYPPICSPPLSFGVFF